MKQTEILNYTVLLNIPDIFYEVMLHARLVAVVGASQQQVDFQMTPSLCVGCPEITVSLNDKGNDALKACSAHSSG